METPEPEPQTTEKRRFWREAKARFRAKRGPEYYKKYRAEHKEAILAAKKRWSLANPEYFDRYREEHRQEIRDYSKQLGQKHKRIILEKYGGCECFWCGDRDILALSLDHINNDGAAHRKEIGVNRLYRWIRRNNYPPGFQVLCISCNVAKQHNGGVLPPWRKDRLRIPDWDRAIGV